MDQKDTTLELIRNAMQAAIAQDATIRGFLIDGFPRNVQQAMRFEETVMLRDFLVTDCFLVLIANWMFIVSRSQHANTFFSLIAQTKC
jgi:adenylate kinase family enzyme